MKTLSLVAGALLLIGWQAAADAQRAAPRIGQEVAIARHLPDGEEFRLPLGDLIAFGRTLFEANWTVQDGGGRPRSRGTGAALAESEPLSGGRGFNRISGPDANSCQGCHNAPHGISGGGGDFVTHIFDGADRFDFVTFRPAAAHSLQAIGGARATPGLFGAGYLEMLARQMTEDLQRIRDTLAPGETTPLVSKGVSFGVLTRTRDGRWDCTGVEGLSDASVAIAPRTAKPSLVVRPWQQGGRIASLREVTNDAFNRHHGMQATERFGKGTDADGDRIENELTRADVTAITVFQATLAVPGRLIPNDAEIEHAVLTGERLFEQIGCSTCHVPSLALARSGWIYSEPNPFNATGNLRAGDARSVRVDLRDPVLPSPRLEPSANVPDVIQVPAFTDFKLHDITDGTAPEGERRFLTRRLWGAANEPPYFHHGLFTTMRRAVLAHAGEALAPRRAFEALSPYQQDSIIEFLKTLQVLKPGTVDRIVDEKFRPKQWPPATAQ